MRRCWTAGGDIMSKKVKTVAITFVRRYVEPPRIFFLFYPILRSLLTYCMSLLGLLALYWRAKWHITTFVRRYIEPPDKDVDDDIWRCARICIWRCARICGSCGFLFDNTAWKEFLCFRDLVRLSQRQAVVVQVMSNLFDTIFFLSNVLCDLLDKRN